MLAAESIPHYHGVSASRSDRRELVERGTVEVEAGPPGRFAVTVDGECMNPPYPNGTVVIFEQREGTEAIESNRDYHVTFVGGEVTFKRIVLDPKRKGVVILRCRNPDKKQYPDREVRRAEIRSVARVRTVQMDPEAIE